MGGEGERGVTSTPFDQSMSTHVLVIPDSKFVHHYRSIITIVIIPQPPDHHFPRTGALWDRWSEFSIAPVLQLSVVVHRQTVRCSVKDDGQMEPTQGLTRDLCDETAIRPLHKVTEDSGGSRIFQMGGRCFVTNGGAHILFSGKKCMKLKEIGLKWGAHVF